VKWLRSVVAVIVGFLVTTTLYVALGKAIGGFILQGVDFDEGGNLSAPGTARLGLLRLVINLGTVYLALSAVGGFVAALLAPARRSWHGLSVGVAVSAALMLLVLGSVLRGQEPFSWFAVVGMIGIVLGGGIGGLLGQWFVATASRVASHGVGTSHDTGPP
jgi:hypothetical protein